jgi:hypothetical protein
MTISFTQSRAITWICTLCQARCDLQETSIPQFAYTCSCGTVYMVTFGQQVTIEENKALDRIFSIERYSGGIAVCLRWDQNKRHFEGINEQCSWSEALDQAIGYCWRVYGEEIIEHIKAMPEQTKDKQREEQPNG